jgi:hypothetical protein
MRALLKITVSLDTPIWKLEAALKCRSYKTERYATPIHMIKLTQQREITPSAQPPAADRACVAALFGVNQGALSFQGVPGGFRTIIGIGCGSEVD